jgi:hypothetical protein
MNQPVFYEGMPSDFIMIVKQGSFEITRTFDEDNCYLCGNIPSGPMQAIKKRSGVDLNRSKAK